MTSMTTPTAAQVDVTRPYWQHRDCPAWCTVMHWDTNPVDDRNCYADLEDGTPVDVTLSLHDPWRQTGPTGEFAGAYPDGLNLWVEQGPREGEPTFVIARRSDPGRELRFTPDEFAALAAKVTALRDLTTQPATR